jgi:insulysin
VDKTFEKPKLSMMLALRTPVAYDSVESSVLCDLMVRFVKEELNEFSYVAEMAGMYYVLNQSMHGMELFVSGYSHKLETLLRAVLDKLLHFEVSESLFARLQNKCMLKYKVCASSVLGSVHHEC